MRDVNRINYPTLWTAYAHAKELIAAGNGFTFRVRTNSGETFDGVPPSAEPIECSGEGLLTLEFGADTVIIPSRSIETITVIAVA